MKHPLSQQMFPKCAQRNLQFVCVGDNEIQGFDELALAKILTPTELTNFRAKVKRDFVCGHAKYTDKGILAYQQVGTEVHCYFAEDVEKFLGGTL